MTGVYFNSCRKHLCTLLSNMTECENVETAAATTVVLSSLVTTSKKL